MIHRHTIAVAIAAAIVCAVVLAVSMLADSGTTYAAWALDSGLAGADADHAADPDSDGLPNLLEYAFGGDPLTGDRPLPGEPVASIVTESYLVRPGTQDYFQIRYRIAPDRSDLYVRPEITYTLDKSSWVHGAASIRQIADDNGFTIARETRQMRDKGYHTRVQGVASALQGASLLSSGTDLVITGTGVHVTIYNAAATQAGTLYNSTDLRTGDMLAVAQRSLVGGALTPVARLSDAAPE